MAADMAPPPAAPVLVPQCPTDSGPDGDMPTRLSITCDWSWPTCTLSLAGSLDIDSLSAFDCQFDQIGCEPFTEVVVDVHQLRCIDDAGLASLRRLSHFVVEHRGTMRILGGTELAEAGAVQIFGTSMRRSPACCPARSRG
jgi:anti-anti-sigma regulatory factor